MDSKADRDPRHHTQKMQMRLQEMMDHLRQDIVDVDEPQLKAMFETAAEVLGGLKKAFGDYEKKTSPPGNRAPEISACNDRPWRQAERRPYFTEMLMPLISALICRPTCLPVSSS